MKLFHCTLVTSAKSIRRDRRIRTDKSRTRRREIWLCCSTRVPWGFVHTVRRHGGRVENVVALEVEVPRGWLAKSGWAGLWRCARDIPWERVQAVWTFDDVSAKEGTGNVA
jgi:hypothetical protein